MINTILAVSGVHTLALVVAAVAASAVGTLLFLRANPHKASEANEYVGKADKAVDSAVKSVVETAKKL